MIIDRSAIQLWLTGLTLLDEEGNLVRNSHRFNTDTGEYFDRDRKRLGVSTVWAVCCANQGIVRRARMCLPEELQHKAIITPPAPPPPRQMDNEVEVARHRKAMNEWFEDIRALMQSVSNG